MFASRIATARPICPWPGNNDPAARLKKEGRETDRRPLRPAAVRRVGFSAPRRADVAGGKWA